MYTTTQPFLGQQSFCPAASWQLWVTDYARGAFLVFQCHPIVISSSLFQNHTEKSMMGWSVSMCSRVPSAWWLCPFIRRHPSPQSSLAAGGDRRLAKVMWDYTENLGGTILMGLRPVGWAQSRGKRRIAHEDEWKVCGRCGKRTMWFGFLGVERSDLAVLRAYSYLYSRIALGGLREPRGMLGMEPKLTARQEPYQLGCHSSSNGPVHLV